MLITSRGNNYRIGLKLLASNIYYISSALDLFNKRIIDYVELFITPDSAEFINFWTKLNLPYVLHAPHSAVGFNFAIREYEKSNFITLELVDRYREALKPKFIIFHPGTNGTVNETIRQLSILTSKFSAISKISVIENKPAKGLKGGVCIGSTPSEIAKIISESNIGFCLDIGHAICAANSVNIAWLDFINDFLSFNPSMFHLSDGNINSEIDSHLNFGHGNYDFKSILNIIQEKSILTIETNKKSKNNLEDFKEDVDFLRKIKK